MRLFWLSFIISLPVFLGMGCANNTDDTLTDDERLMRQEPIPKGKIPDAPVLSPREAIADMKVEEGFEIELVVAEPDVIAPVAITFDADGAMWVVEMQQYMPNTEGIGEDQPTGQIVVFQDNDLDGTYESRTVFLDKLVLPRAISLVKEGILLAEPPNLWYVENHDYQAGKKTLVDSTYAIQGNVEHQPNGLLWARDNWIYSAKGDKRYRQKDGTWLIESTEFRGQWGISQDDLGRLFYNHNGAVLLADDVLPNGTPQNPHHALMSNGTYGIQRGENFVYPRRITPGVNRAYREGVLDEQGKLVEVTAACGPVIYRGDQFPDSYYGNAFVAEPAGNLIKRVLVTENNATIEASFPYKNQEFLTATDERFRPVNLVNAPDGTVYVVDMYRGVIQHVTYLTDYLKRQVKYRDLDKHLALGRIYRIKHAGSPPRKPLQLLNAPTDSLIATLQHPNGWWRDTAQRLLVQRQDKQAIETLKKLAINQQSPIQQVTALWTLEGLDALSLSFLQSVKGEAMVQRTIIKLAGNLAGATSDVPIANFLQGMIGNANKITDLEIAYALKKIAQNKPELVFSSFAKLIKRYPDDPLFIDATLGALENKEEVFKENLTRQGVGTTELWKKAFANAILNANTIPASEFHVLSASEQLQFDSGKKAFETYCATCHHVNGKGLPNQAPALVASSWVLQSEETLAKIILDGLQGAVSVNGTEFKVSNVVMPGIRQSTEFNDKKIANIMTYIRNAWGNSASAVKPETVHRVRTETASWKQLYTTTQLQEQASATWRNLFDGKTLNGWHQLGGKATYEVRDGMLVGKTVLETPNSFLVTDEHFGDFILELEFKVDSLLNSGIQIRSNSYADYNDGQVHGYQIEIDPSPRAWSAGIYEEGRRGWLYNLEGKTEAQQAFKQNDWNHYRIEAIGNHIRTWINGVLAGDLIDTRTRSGFIGLQVHGIGTEKSKLGIEVLWRNIKIKDFKNPILSASSDPIANPITALLDKDTLTYWSASENNQWLLWDLKKIRKVNRVLLDFYKGNERSYQFKIVVSKDGKHWKRAIQSKSSGNTDAPETFNFDAVEARYIKLIGFCNNKNRENAYEAFMPLTYK